MKGSQREEDHVVVGIFASAEWLLALVENADHGKNVALAIDVLAERRFIREKIFRRIVAEEGFTTTDGAVGVLATGTLDEASIRSLLANMPPGTWELITHPGYNDAELGQVQTRLKESREKERQALMAMGRPDGVELISFAQIAGDESEIAMDSPVK